MATVSAIPDILTWAGWIVQHADQIRYEEVRPFPLGSALPMICDCAATYTNIYFLAGVIDDPNGPAFNYDGYGNTVTLAANGEQIPESQVQPGNAVIYYNGYGFTPSDSVHVAVVTDVSGQYANDPMTMSHGADPPAYMTVSYDGRPHQYFRFNTQKTAPPTPPAPPTPIPVTEEPMLTLVQNPNNKGWAVLNLTDGTFRGFSDGDLLSFWEANGVKKAVRQPTVAEWAHFEQATIRGTI